MEYGVFKASLALLFFGSVFVFGFWQLVALRRSAPNSEETPRRGATHDHER
jgi:hypothetical protein